MCIDGMYVSKRGFLTSIDKTIRFRCAVTIPNRKTEEFYNAIDVILRLYNGAGFTVITIHADREFKTLFDEVKDNLDVTMNYAPAGDHVPEAERNNRTLKERIQLATTAYPAN